MVEEEKLAKPATAEETEAMHLTSVGPPEIKKKPSLASFGVVPLSEDEFYKQYKILERIKQGGQGTVFKIQDIHSGIIYAGKCIPMTEDIEEGLSEMRALQNLSHPTIIEERFFYEVETRKETEFWILYDFRPEPTLAEYLEKEKRFTIEEIRHIRDQILSGLSAAHKRGIVHRDLKPSNIKYDEQSGAVVILDFGIAKFLGDETQTKSIYGDFRGTPLYMAPEQEQKGAITPATDYYGLGRVLLALSLGTELTKLDFFKLMDIDAVINTITHIPASFRQSLRFLLSKNPAIRIQGLKEDFSISDTTLTVTRDMHRDAAIEQEQKADALVTKTFSFMRYGTFQKRFLFYRNVLSDEGISYLEKAVENAEKAEDKKVVMRLITKLSKALDTAYTIKKEKKYLKALFNLSVKYTLENSKRIADDLLNVLSNNKDIPLDELFIIVHCFEVLERKVSAHKAEKRIIEAYTEERRFDEAISYAITRQQFTQAVDAIIKQAESNGLDEISHLYSETKKILKTLPEDAQKELAQKAGEYIFTQENKEYFEIAFAIELFEISQDQKNITEARKKYIKIAPFSKAFECAVSYGFYLEAAEMQFERAKKGMLDPEHHREEIITLLKDAQTLARKSENANLVETITNELTQFLASDTDAFQKNSVQNAYYDFATKNEREKFIRLYQQTGILPEKENVQLLYKNAISLIETNPDRIGQAENEVEAIIELLEMFKIEIEPELVQEIYKRIILLQEFINYDTINYKMIINVYTHTKLLPKKESLDEIKRRYVSHSSYIRFYDETYNFMNFTNITHFEVPDLFEKLIFVQLFGMGDLNSDKISEKNVILRRFIERHIQKEKQKFIDQLIKMDSSNLPRLIYRFIGLAISFPPEIIFEDNLFLAFRYKKFSIASNEKEISDLLKRISTENREKKKIYLNRFFELIFPNLEEPIQQSMKITILNLTFSLLDKQNYFEFADIFTTVRSKDLKEKITKQLQNHLESLFFNKKIDSAKILCNAIFDSRLIPGLVLDSDERFKEILVSKLRNTLVVPNIQEIYSRFFSEGDYNMIGILYFLTNVRAILPEEYKKLQFGMLIKKPEELSIFLKVTGFTLSHS